MATRTYEQSKTAARERLMAAVADLDLTPAETRTVEWLKGWDTDCVDRIAAIVEKARKA